MSLLKKIDQVLKEQKILAQEKRRVSDLMLRELKELENEHPYLLKEVSVFADHAILFRAHGNQVRLNPCPDPTKSWKSWELIYCSRYVTGNYETVREHLVKILTDSKYRLPGSTDYDETDSRVWRE